jgi:small subunit ribosomal protein S12
LCKFVTILQAWRQNITYKRINFSRTPALQKRPQVKGSVTLVRTMSPKKPNSAARHIAKVALSNALRITGRLPGQGYLCSKHNRVLVNGGRANDLPGVGYTLVRGAYDFAAALFKRKRRSIYGVSR